LPTGRAVPACGKPLSDPKTSKVDERLLGRWIGAATTPNPDAAGTQWFVGRHSVARSPEGLMESITISCDDAGRKVADAKTMRANYVSVTRIGAADLLNSISSESLAADLEEHVADGLFAGEDEATVFQKVK
jgi:hypothetical protein